MGAWEISFYKPKTETETEFIVKTTVTAVNDGDAVSVAKKKLHGEHPDISTYLWGAVEHHGELEEL